MKQKLKELKTKLALKKGSILVYTLIVLMVMLSIALSIFTAAVRDKKNVNLSTQSVQAFSVADSGSEIALQKVKKSPNSTVASLGTDCDNGTVTIKDVVGGEVKLTFYNESGAPILCSDTIGNARKIKSVGYYSGAARAVEVAVAGTGGCAFYELSSTSCGGYYCPYSSGYSNDNPFTMTDMRLCYELHNKGWPVGRLEKENIYYNSTNRFEPMCGFYNWKDKRWKPSVCGEFILDGIYCCTTGN